MGNWAFDLLDQKGELGYNRVASRVFLIFVDSLRLQMV